MPFLLAKSAIGKAANVNVVLKNNILWRFVGGHWCKSLTFEQIAGLLKTASEKCSGIIIFARIYSFFYHTSKHEGAKHSNVSWSQEKKSVHFCFAQSGKYMVYQSTTGCILLMTALHLNVAEATSPHTNKTRRFRLSITVKSIMGMADKKAAFHAMLFIIKR